LNQIIEQYKFLSTLKNAKDYCVTYYVGNDLRHVSHLSNCCLICNKEFKPNLKNVEILNVDNPQLFFYKLSEKYKKDYIENDKLFFNEKYKSYIHKNSKIDENVSIHPNCVIGNIIINNGSIVHPNCTIYSETIIGKNVTVESNTSIGAEGVMWVWDGENKVKLHQLGNVKINDNVFIGSNVTIVRGSANETTIIGQGSFIAHGTKIGHGCVIGENNHFANNVSVGGSVQTFKNCFFGSGSVISPGVKINHEIVLGAGSTLINDTLESGVYVGSPAKKIKEIQNKMKGVPQFNTI